MNNIIKRVWNQNRMVNIEGLSGAAFQAEDGGHTFQISGIDDTGATVSLSGTVAGVFRRPDNADIALTGSASGGVASVTLTDDCYAVPGRFGLTIFVTSGGQKTAVYACIGTVANTSGGAVAGETPQDVVDLINAISAAVATIPPSYTDLMAAIAPTYSSSALYAVGSYAWYDGDLYRCTTAITTAETWTASHWTITDIGGDIVHLRNVISSKTGNLLPDYSADSWTSPTSILITRNGYALIINGTKENAGAVTITDQFALGAGSYEFGVGENDALTDTGAFIQIYSGDEVIAQTQTKTSLVLSTAKNVSLRILLNAGSTFNNLSVKPMLFSGSIPNTYVPQVSAHDYVARKNVGEALSSISNLTNATAPAYSSSATYSVGDYVWHDGALYRCTTPITTAETWTAGHWTDVVLGDDVSDLKSALTDVDTLLEISPFPVTQSGTHITTSTSEVIALQDVTLKANVLYDISCTIDAATTGTVYLYIKKKSDSTNLGTGSIAVGSTSATFSVNVSENTDAYIAFTVGAANVTCTATIDTRFTESKRNLADDVANNTAGVNLNNITAFPAWENGGIDNATGQTNNDGSAVRSRIIKYFRPGELVKVENNTTNSVLWIIYYTKVGDSYIFNSSESVNAGSEKSFTGNKYYTRFDLRSGIAYADGIVFTATGIIKEELNALDNRISALESGSSNESYSIGNANLIRESLPDYYFSAPTWVNAETAADMTDTTKTYLYLGSETGYTNGAVYTYNSDESEWQTDENASYNVDEYLNQKIKDIPGTPSCIFFTDIHWRSQPDQHLPEIVQYLLAKIGRKPVIFGGDSVVAESNKYMGYKELRRFTDKMKDSFGDVYYPVIGDHDNNAVGADTPGELAIQEIPFVKCYEGAFGVMPEGITAISADTLDGITLTDAQYAEAVAYLKMNYYFDDTEMQTRYIFITSGMEMGALKDAFGITNVGYQIYLVLNFLYDAVLNAPSGYNVVLTMHNLVEDDNTDPNDKQPAPPNAYLMMAIKMLYARKNKANYVAGTGTVSNANLLAYFEPDSGKNYKIYHFDGENLPDIGHVVVLSGDVHYNSSLITSGSAVASLTAQVIQPGTEIDENQILMISTQTASYGSVTQSSLCYPMARGTVTEQALDILSFTENAVNLTRVGAGYDRTFPYSS